MSLPQLPGVGVFGFAPGASVTAKPRVLKAPFGSGYVGRIGDGINTINKEVRVVFENLIASEQDLLEQFFEERAGYKAFLCRLPGKVVDSKFICPEWTVSYNDGRIATIQAKFELVYDP